jgi:hypothetical protein
MHLRKTPVLGGASGFCKSIVSAGIFGVLALMAPLASHAQVLTVTIFDGTNTLVVTDGSANDSSPATGIVTVDTGLTGPFILGANSVVTSSFSQTATSSSLTTAGTLNGATGAAASQFTVTSSITNVNIPSGMVRMFSDTSTVSFQTTPAPNKGTDTNGVDTTNMLNGLSTFDTPFTFNATGAATESGSFNGPGFVFLNTGQFAITSKTVINVVGGGKSQYTTNSVLTSAAVPEPGAVALFSSLAVCGSAFGLRRLRRK